MKKTVYLIALLGVLIIILGGCASTDNEEGSADIVPTVTVPAELETLVKEISADLEKRAGAKPEEVALTQIEAVTWPDGSLGCPQPGMMYTMAIVEGYRITYKVAGEAYYYHTAGGKRFNYCDEKALTQTPPASPVSKDK